MKKDALHKLGFSGCLALAGLLVLASMTAAFADCSTGSPATCAYVPVAQSLTVQPKAFVFGQNDATPTCEVVSNSCSLDVMVPTGTESEWTSFLADHEGCVSLAECSTCSQKTVTNGTVNADCSITCNSGYTLLTQGSLKICGNKVCGTMITLCPSGYTNIVCPEACSSKGGSVKWPISATIVEGCYTYAQSCYAPGVH